MKLNSQTEKWVINSSIRTLALMEKSQHNQEGNK